MENSKFDIEFVKKRVLAKYPYFGSILKSVKYQLVDDSTGIKTAATDGNTIYFNQTFMENLSLDNQLFIFAHEVAHIACKHFARQKNRDTKLWNLATDAVINQLLIKDKLKIPKDAINYQDALNMSSESYYKKLVEIKNNQSNLLNKLMQDAEKISNHSLWNNDIENDNKNQDQKQGDADDTTDITEKVQEKSKGKSDNNQDSNDDEIVEQDIFENNRVLKKELADEIKNELEKKLKGKGDKFSQVFKASSIGKATKPVHNWKRRLKKELEIDDECWGRKFSDSHNNYAMRIEDCTYDEQAETEIILDVSGSVSEELLRTFLRQVKTILHCSKIKVGFFSTVFSGFKEIKSEKDIDNLQIDIGGGTDFDLANRSFSNDKTINKICFTDGIDYGDPEIENSRKDIIWVSFANKKFRPGKCKVIYVDPEDIIDYKINGQDDELVM